MARGFSRSLPKYRRHRATGQAVVTLNGQDFYLGTHGTRASKAEYDRLLGEWIANGRRVHDSGGDITVVELCNQYRKFAQAYYRKNGRQTDELHKLKSAMKYLTAAYGRQPANEVGPLALKAIRQKMVDDDLSRKYVNEHVGRIKRIFKWAAAEELIPETTYRSLALVDGLRRGRTEARETAPVMPVDDDAVDATLPYMPAVVADMARLQRLSGMRPEEVTVVRPCDIDRSGDVWTYTPESHKTEHHGRERVVYLCSQAQEILLRYLARGADDYCFRPCDSEEKRLADRHAQRKTAMSCGNRPGTNRVRKPKRQPGDRYTTCTYRRAIYRACDKAHPAPEGLEGDELKAWRKKHRWAPNRLRHTAGTEVRRRFGLEAAQVFLGHANARVTEVYAERDHEKGAAVARAIG